MIEELKPLLGKLSVFAKDRMGFKHPPRLFFKNDSQNSEKALGKTAYYNPEEQAVTLYTNSRHPKDILRSFAHELVHHTQNLRGDLSAEKTGHMSSNYAQDNEHMRNMEKEAYLQGNMCFRDWEDSLEDKDIYTIKLAESRFLKENKKMTTKSTKDFLRETIEKALKEQVDQRKLDQTILPFLKGFHSDRRYGVMPNLEEVGSFKEAHAMAREAGVPFYYWPKGKYKVYATGLGKKPLTSPELQAKLDDYGDSVTASMDDIAKAPGFAGAEDEAEKLKALASMTKGDDKDDELMVGLYDDEYDRNRLAAEPEEEDDEYDRNKFAAEPKEGVEHTSEVNLGYDMMEKEAEEHARDQQAHALKAISKLTADGKITPQQLRDLASEMEGGTSYKPGDTHLEPGSDEYINREYGLDGVRENEELEEGGCGKSHKKEDETNEGKKCPDCDGSGCPTCEVKEQNEENEELEEAGVKNPGKYKTGMKAGYDRDGDGVPNGADPDADDGSVNESKIQTPEQENTLYEQRFTPKNNRLYEKLVKQWTK